MSQPETFAPTIFSPSRRAAARERAERLSRAADAPRFLAEDMAEDVIERVAFLRETPGKAMVLGHGAAELAQDLAARGWDAQVSDPTVNDEQPLPWTGLDLIVSMLRLEFANDLPGALIHLRRTLRPGGLMIANLTGAGSLPKLKSALRQAESERPALRTHPQVDVRAGGQLLQRAGYADPVADSRLTSVRYRSPRRLVADLRAMGLSSQLAESAPLAKATWARAETLFSADNEPELFEILTLSGRAV